MALIRHGSLYTIHTSRRSAVRAVTDPDGTLIWRATYSPFGQADINEDPDCDGKSFTFHLRLPGQYADPEIHTNYNVHRHYDPATGRYQTPDPLGLADGVNTYAYVHSDPMNQVDPLGLYGIDLHYYMTYFLARKAGIPAETAQIIANATEYVDQNPQTLPCHGFECVIPNGQSLQLYHFTMNEDAAHRGDIAPRALATRLKAKGWIDADFDYDALAADEQAQWYERHRFLFPTSPQLARLRRAAFDLYPACGNRNPHAKAQLYGEYLHALEDSFAHRDNADEPYSRKQIPGMDEGYIGHGLAGHNPDKTYNHRGDPNLHLYNHQWNNNEIRTLAAEHAVFYKLRSDFSDVIQLNTNTTAQTYRATTDAIWSTLSGAEPGQLGYARIGYDSLLSDLNPFTSDHPIDGPKHNQRIGVLQRFNASHGEGLSKARQFLDQRLSELRIQEYGKTGKHEPSSDRIKYLGNITENDLKAQGFYYHDPDDGGKEKPALLLPCGSYKTESACSQ
ncbi:RHS repeat-associated core domain-containing protein [Salinisphaera sp.]|uniref:RHS repeat-associated core domain-containing protein n=1 Tax=Salinisphaera sp. TaxID=1914330 RepID=UPI002D773642|nr:RHS repeat-associated core domain-containing protein [Salinisphaera sp.]HET7314930.1 RHS repeat-associated core domain-containing protein [Salinisphaera sp.]